MGGRIQFAPTITGHPNKIGFIDPSLNSKKNAMFMRKQLLEGSGKESLFLWGARQTGKSTLLKQLFPDALWFDLLKSDVYRRYQKEPSQFREVIIANTTSSNVIVDEIQKIPELLDEIHWLIENHQVRFI